MRAHLWEGLDAERIELAQTNLIGPDLSQRLADSAWRLIMQDGELVYLLLECQSEPDATMPLRMLHAVATLYLALSQLCWPQHNWLMNSDKSIIFNEFHRRCLVDG